MTELIVVMVTGFVVIATATLISPRIGVASPLVLVLPRSAVCPCCW